jgi:hypothetical protein
MRVIMTLKGFAFSSKYLPVTKEICGYGTTMGARRYNESEES